MRETFNPAVMVTNENKSQPSQWTKHKAKNTRVRPTGFAFKERLPFSAIKRWQASSAICRRANSAASSSFNRTTSWRKLDVLAETAWTCSSKDSSRYRKEANTLSCSLLKLYHLKGNPWQRPSLWKHRKWATTTIHNFQLVLLSLFIATEVFFASL